MAGDSSRSITRGVGDVVVQLGEWAANGVVAWYVVRATGALEQWGLSRKRAHLQARDPHGQPLRPQAARAAARWAINEMYDETLPSDVEPASETLDPATGTWAVTFEHAGQRYAAELLNDTPKPRVIVRRDQL